MHIKKFDSNYSRRFFMKQMAAGALATGVLAPLWPTIAMGRTLEGVYPDEIRLSRALPKVKLTMAMSSTPTMLISSKITWTRLRSCR